MRVAIVPARSGSKRIKNKNIINFYGKPIIQHTINFLFKTNKFDKIYISTDSKKISDISEECGAEVPFLRTKKLSDDHAPTHEVICDMIDRLSLSKDSSVFCVYPTAILLKKKDILDGIKLLNNNKNNFVICVSKTSDNITRSFKVSKLDKISSFLSKKKKYKSSHGLNKYYADLGYFYAAKASTWINNN